MGTLSILKLDPQRQYRYINKHWKTCTESLLLKDLTLTNLKDNINMDSKVAGSVNAHSKLITTSTKQWLPSTSWRLCQLKKVSTINRFHKLVFDRGDSSFECFNRATQKVWVVAVGSSQISYKGKTILVFVDYKQLESVG